ncbi:hypothetical protein K474DRAFT_1702142 [Panus rudis PR-1116 ss-1]|nr:hypothetical protein K474DRAFT_1702142 [Panus rudis PR-1116 ss-1]
MAHSAAKAIHLHPNSLYVHTTPLISNLFHWAFVHVDSQGVATRHHWAATSLDARHGPEAYVEHPLPSGATSKIEKDTVLAYFHILECPSISVEEFRIICSSIFPTSFPTVQENRQANITCRTFITHVLARILGSEERAVEIENVITKKSREYSGTYASDFLLQRPYETIVISVDKGRVCCSV